MADDSANQDLILETALAYIEAGIKCLPLYGPNAQQKRHSSERVRHPGKQPVLEGWQKSYLSAQVFQEHYRVGDNLGAVTGRISGFICIDCDTKKGGLDWYNANQASLGQYVKEVTGSGGIHLYYRYPLSHDEKIPSRIGLFPGVDFLADSGTQVVTAPSVHKDGGRYYFENGLCLADVPDEAGDVPDWILREVLKHAENDSDETFDATGLNVDDMYEVARCKEALRVFPAAIEGQGGDTRTFAAAALCKDFLLSPKMAMSVLSEVYNPRCSPPWSREDLWEKVKHGYKYGKNKPGVRVAGADFPPEDPAELINAVEEVRPAPTYTVKLPIASARHFISRNQGRVLCQQAQLYTYDTQSQHWEMIEDEMFEAHVLKDINDESQETARGLRMGQLRDIARAVKRELQASSPRNVMPDTWLDQRSGQFVTLRNGILDIRTGTLLPHSPLWFSFTTLPFDYDSAASCPTFLSFLDAVWEGDAELVQAMKLWMGYVLTSSLSAQKFAVLIGESRAGKSTLARVIEALVGKENTAACSLMQFGGEFGLEPVLGKRLAIFNDAQRLHGTSGDVATERIISIVGNDPQPVNRKNRGILTVHLPAKIMLVCNEIPHFVNRRDALTNRMIVFPFRKSFKGKEDPTLHDKLMAELPGILNWAIDGARAIMDGQKLMQSAAGETAIQEIAEVLDSIQGFIADAIEFTSDTSTGKSFINSKTLYETYKQWCRDANMGTHGMKRFFQEFKSKAGQRVVASRSPDRRRTKGFYGVRLIADATSEFSSLRLNDDDDDDQSDIPF
jgi:putative DNA primase/helicase